MTKGFVTPPHHLSTHFLRLRCTLVQCTRILPSTTDYLYAPPASPSFPPCFKEERTKNQSLISFSLYTEAACRHGCLQVSRIFLIFALMRLTLLQTAPEWGNPERNREDARRMLMGTLKTDLVVLPEMFSTGFVTDPAGVAEEGEGIK